MKRSAPPSASGRNTGNTGHVTLPTPLGFLSRRCLERLQTRSGLTTAPQPSGESALVGAEARRALHRLFRNGNSAGFFFFLCRNIHRPSLDRPSRRKKERKKKSRGSKMASRVVPTATPVCSLSALKSATGRGRPRRPDSPHHWWRNSRPLSALPSPACRHGRSAVSSSFAVVSGVLGSQPDVQLQPPGDTNVLQRSEIISVGPQHPAALAIHKDWACFFGGGC